MIMCVLYLDIVYPSCFDITNVIKNERRTFILLFFEKEIFLNIIILKCICMAGVFDKGCRLIFQFTVFLSAF